jgi:hypothetical protein
MIIDQMHHQLLISIPQLRNPATVGSRACSSMQTLTVFRMIEEIAKHQHFMSMSSSSTS